MYCTSNEMHGVFGLYLCIVSKKEYAKLLLKVQKSLGDFVDVDEPYHDKSSYPSDSR